MNSQNSTVHKYPVDYNSGDESVYVREFRFGKNESKHPVNCLKLGMDFMDLKTDYNDSERSNYISENPRFHLTLYRRNSGMMAEVTIEQLEKLLEKAKQIQSLAGQVVVLK